MDVTCDSPIGKVPPRFIPDTNYVRICEMLLKRGANPNFAFSPNGETLMESLASADDYLSPKLKEVFLKYMQKNLNKNRSKRRELGVKASPKRRVRSNSI